MRRLETVREVFAWLTVMAVAVLMLFSVISLSTFDRDDRTLFGYRAMVVLSDSMKATDFAAGDVILIQNVDPSTLQEGDIISFISRNYETFGKIVTHKIREVTYVGDERCFVTYGTTTDTDDKVMVNEREVVGKYQRHIPFVGRLFQYIKTGKGYTVCVLFPVLLLIVMESFRCCRLTVRYRREIREEYLEELQPEINAVVKEKCAEALEKDRERRNRAIARVIVDGKRILSGEKKVNWLKVFFAVCRVVSATEEKKQETALKNGQ